VPELQLHRFDVGAGGYSKAGCGVAQLVRRQSKQSDLLRSRIEEPRPEIGVPQHAAFGGGEHEIAGEARAEAWRHLSVHGAVLSLQELIARARLMAHSEARDLVENVDIVADLLRVTRSSYPDKEKRVFDALPTWGSGVYAFWSGASTEKEEEGRDLAYEIASTLPRGSLEREYYQTLGASVQARMRFMHDDHSDRSDGRQW
jgi:hypothetical protein